MPSRLLHGFQPIYSRFSNLGSGHLYFWNGVVCHKHVTTWMLPPGLEFLLRRMLVLGLLKRRGIVLFCDITSLSDISWESFIQDWDHQWRGVEWCEICKSHRSLMGRKMLKWHQTLPDMVFIRLGRGSWCCCVVMLTNVTSTCLTLKFSSSKIKLHRCIAAKAGVVSSILLLQGTACSTQTLLDGEDLKINYQSLTVLTLQQKGNWWIRFKFNPPDMREGTFHLQRKLENGIGFFTIFPLIPVNFCARNKVIFFFLVFSSV